MREEIADEAMQRNPLIVAPCEDRYLLLDGAHRAHALGELDCRFALVQLVDLPERAGSWSHLLDDVGLEESLRSVEEVEVSETEPEQGYLAEARFSGGGKLFARAREEGIVPAVRALWALRKAYPEGGVVRRVDLDRPVGRAAREAVLFYRRLTPEVLAEVVSAGEVLPADATRFIVKERVLNVRYPLGLLEKSEPATRNAELREFVRRSWQGGRVRYYAEPVILFE